jgi:putative ABC transport system permease protein
MLFWTIVKVGLKSLVANPMRSFLAMLGIIIGVAAVISMLALGAGAKKQMLDRIQANGANLMTIWPGNRGSGGVMSGQQVNLVVEDAVAMTEVDGVRRVSPVVGKNVQVKYLNNNAPVRASGVSSTYLPIHAYEIEKDRGRPFSDGEVENMARVAILGPDTVKNLFGVNEPLGETIKINSINFTVIGVTKAKGSQGWNNPDDQVFIPYTTAMKQVFGLDHLNSVDIQAQDDADLKVVQTDLTTLLRKRHRLQAGAPDDFNVRNQADMLEFANAAMFTFTVLLGGIASISLLVGGIGIMNIMLVTVTERTREIGVRKAIGAKERSIMMQFLMESVTISGLGGGLGVLLGVGSAAALEYLTTKYAAQPFPTVVEWSSVILAIGFSALVGIFFGWYPALRAARLDPVEALRYE